MSNTHPTPETQPPEPRRKRRGCFGWMVVLTLYFLGFAFLLTVATLLGAYLVYEHVTQPGVEGESVLVAVPRGATGQRVAEIMRQYGLVEHEVFFRLAIRLDKKVGTIKHGTYELHRGLSPTQLLHTLYEGPNVKAGPTEIPDEWKLTIPEGLSVVQMADLFEHPDVFKEAARNPELVQRLGLDTDSLEGFLMPNTYFFHGPPTERDAVERMVEQFEREWAELQEEVVRRDASELPYPTRSLARNQDLLGLMTVASLVEEEAVTDEERPLVAAVIYNRMAKGMPLELDATLQFALNKYGERMLYEDKEVESPYNTYKNKGLPPGPISSPGVESIRAALFPADEDYLYFVSNADGKSHTFSKTMKEHLRAVARYRKEISAKRRELRRQQISEGNP